MLVVDNGGYEIKAGIVTKASETSSDSCKSFIKAPNLILEPKGHLLQQVVADQVDQLLDHSNAIHLRPIDRGYVNNWNLQSKIWERLFSVMKITPESAAITVPYVMPRALQNHMDQVVFEEFNFNSYVRVPAPKMALSSCESKEVCLIVESGFSFTHVVPFFNNVEVREAVRRIPVGGKVLTNVLKSRLSLKQWNMMDETSVVRDIKEACCYVSTDFCAEMKAKRKGLRWVLPDFQKSSKGYIFDQSNITTTEEKTAEETILNIDNSDRIAVPEVLFHPSDIGMTNVCGLACAIVESVSACPEELQGLLYLNITLTGGSTQFNNFKERLMLDLRPLVPTEYEINITMLQDDKNTYPTWSGAAAYTFTNECRSAIVTRAEYLESGSNLCRSKFNC